MDFTALISELSGVVSSFAQSHPLITFVVLIILAFLMYRKTVFFISVFTLTLLVAGALYLIISVSNPGISKKEELIKRSLPENLFRSPGIR